MTKLIRRLSWFAAGAIAVILATVALLFVLQQQALDDLTEKREFARIARNAAALSTDRETSIRGFLLTRDERSLLRNNIGKAALPRALDTLAMLARADRARARRVSDAIAALRRWDAEFATPAAEGRLTGKGTVLAGKPLFDVVRARFGELIANGDAGFAEASARLRRIELVGALAVVAELALFFGALLYLIRGKLIGQARDLASQQELLEQQAVELELQMDEAAATSQSLALSLAETQRKDAELRTTITNLSRSEERYRYVSKATTDAMYEWDIKTDAFEWGEGMRGLFGYTEADIGSAPSWIWGLVHPDDVEHLNETFWAAYNGGADRWQLTYRLRRKDGKYASVEGRAYIVRGEDGAPTRVIGVITDRSQQLSLEEQLRQSQKMEAVGRLAGGIAHDFNNILTVIRMSSEFLLADLPEGHESRHEATEIVKASDRASALTRQLLTFSRHQVLNPRTVVLNEVIAGIQGMIRRVVPENIELGTELDPKLDPITADTGQLEQVILNLVINAADAMPAGGRLDIRSSNVEVDSAFSLGHLDVAPGCYVCMTVSDTGHGMDKDTVSRIFEPFFTTKPVGKGTGLGLATVHGIVTQTGGYIWVYSEPGQGTTFKIFIPRSYEAARPITPRSVKRLVPATETILLVEDEASTREAVERSLVRAGYRVVLAENGAQALEIATANGDKLDMVLTDSMMPEMGGLELAARLKKARPGIRVLMMSGYTEQTTTSRFGISEHPFIEKPFSTAELLTALQQVLHGAPDESPG